jgi:hypothetical protein
MPRLSKDTDKLLGGAHIKRSLTEDSLAMPMGGRAYQEIRTGASNKAAECW